MTEENLSELADEELLRRYRETASPAYRNAIVERYTYIAEILAKKFLRSGVDYDDLYQVGVLALIKAVDRFDEKLGNKLATFFTPSVIGEMKNYFRDKMQLIKVGRENSRIAALVRRVADELTSASGRRPTPQQIADRLEMPLEKILSGLESEVSLVSLDSQIADSETSLYEIIADERNDYSEMENKDFFESCLKLLNEPERRLVAMRFVKEYSQAETAKELGVSQMFVSRLERKILEKLKTAFKDD